MLSIPGVSKLATLASYCSISDTLEYLYNHYKRIWQLSFEQIRGHLCETVCVHGHHFIIVSVSRWQDRYIFTVHYRFQYKHFTDAYVKAIVVWPRETTILLLRTIYVAIIS